jgi:hypothetical protein
VPSTAAYMIHNESEKCCIAGTPRYSMGSGYPVILSVGEPEGYSRGDTPVECCSV